MVRGEACDLSEALDGYTFFKMLFDIINALLVALDVSYSAPPPDR
jgi:hypothetical protein